MYCIYMLLPLPLPIFYIIDFSWVKLLNNDIPHSIFYIPSKSVYTNCCAVCNLFILPCVHIFLLCYTECIKFICIYSINTQLIYICIILVCPFIVKPNGFTINPHKIVGRELSEISSKPPNRKSQPAAETVKLKPPRRVVFQPFG